VAVATPGLWPLALAVCVLLLTLLVLAPPSFAARALAGGPTWYWQNPTPQGNTWSGVSFPSARLGWAAGWAGRIFFTKDGGGSWTFQDSGVQDDLFDVSFVSATTGWMVGDNGTVVRTTNGGRTWTRQDPGVVEALNAVCFVNADSGWAVGAGVIVHTDDGGETWDDQYAWISDASLRDVTFVDDKVGFLCGTDGELRKTTDGGETWDFVQGVYTKETLSSLFMLDKKIGWATIWSKTSYRRGILRTTDGGESWKAVDFNLDCYYESCWFQDAQTGFIAGSDGKLLMTTDGGEKWTAYKTTFRENLLAIAFPTPKLGRIVGIGGLMVRTDDGGKTWRETSAGWTAWLNSVHPVSEREAWVIGAWGSLLHTTDQGSTWRLDPSFRKKYADEFFNSVDFASGKVAVAVGSGGYVLRTKNGTRSWSELPTSTDKSLQAVAFSSSKNGVIVGASGVALHSGDAGENWATGDSGVSDDLFGLAFSGAESGCAVGDHGTVILTGDGGLTWAEVRTPAWDALASVAYATDDVLCAVGGSFDSAEIIRSVDAGKTWQSVDAPVETELDAVRFSSPTVGWAVGIHGVVLGTRDAGATWKLVPTQTSDQFLWDIASWKDKTWIVGSGGSILSNFDLKGGKGLAPGATTAVTSRARHMASAGDSVDLACVSDDTSTASRRAARGPGARAATLRARALATVRQAKAHASTSVLLDFPDARHDADYNDYINLGEETEAGGHAYFYDTHGDPMDAPECKVGLTLKQETDKGWKTVLKTSVYLSPMGTFHWTFTPASKGNYCLRAGIAKGKKWAAGKSSWEPIGVR